MLACGMLGGAGTPELASGNRTGVLTGGVYVAVSAVAVGVRVAFFGPSGGNNTNTNVSSAAVSTKKRQSGARRHNTRAVATARPDPSVYLESDCVMALVWQPRCFRWKPARPGCALSAWHR